MANIARRRVVRDGAKLIGATVLTSSIPMSARGQNVGDEEEAENVNRAPTTKQSVLDLIGNTTLLHLQNIVPTGYADIYLKLESENPTGSMKDRMALAMIEAAEADGRLKPGGNVIEYTGGSTGVSLSFVCGVKGYPLDIVTSDAFSIEKRNHMEALGAKLTIIKSNRGGMDEALTRNMIAAAKKIQEDKGGFWTDQLNNADVLPKYRQMGDEIWNQTNGEIDVFVQGVGTAGSLIGVAAQLKRHNNEIQTVAFEPTESPVISGGEQGPHRIEGIGAGFVVPLWNPDVVDSVEQVSSLEAMQMARRLAKEEGVFAGTSTGGNLVVALRKAKELGPGKKVVTVMCDTGMKYLSTEQYNGEGEWQSTDQN